MVSSCTSVPHMADGGNFCIWNSQCLTQHLEEDRLRSSTALHCVFSLYIVIFFFWDEWGEGIDIFLIFVIIGRAGNCGLWREQ